MCTRCLRRVMQLDPWIHTAWRSSCRQIHIEHWPLLLSLVWHHWLKFCYYISSLILLLHPYLALIAKQKSSWLATLQPDLDSRTFASCVPYLHTHRRIVMSHNLVTKIQKNLTHSKIGTQIAFHWDKISKMTISFSIPPLRQEPSPCLCPNPISIWQLAQKAICRGESSWAQQASIPA